MPKIDDYTIQRIKEAANIVDVIGDFRTLRKQGVNYTCLCPFHQDEHDGNFMVRPKNVAQHPNTWHCFTCDKGGGVIDYLMKAEGMTFQDAIRWLGKKYCIETDGVDVNYTPPPPRPVPPPKPTLTLPMHLVTNREHYERDNLVAYLLTGIRWDTAALHRLPQVLADYHIGHTSIRGREFTIFWLIDEAGQVRTAHLMRYGTDGHRIKRTDQDRYEQDWFHSLLRRKRQDSDPWPYPQYFNPDTHEARPCLFGLHLTSRYPQAEIHLVESEKTAIILATAYGNRDSQLWMACSGLKNLTRDRLAPLIREGRRIIAYPDRDGREAWRVKVEQLHYDRITINEKPVTQWWTEADGPKADIADVIVRSINSHEPPSTVGDIIRELIKKFNLTLADP